MIRKSGVILLGFLVGLFLLVASWPYLSYQMDEPSASITGNSVKDAVSKFYEMSSINQRIFILSQVVLLVVILVVIFIVTKKFQKKELLFKKDYEIKTGEKRSRTDLDILYEMLKKKRNIDLEDVEIIFKVSPEIALGWSKVLENGDLAEVDYPRFGKPVLRLLEEEKVAEDKTSVEASGDVEGKHKKRRVLSKKNKKIKIVKHKVSGKIKKKKVVKKVNKRKVRSNVKKVSKSKIKSKIKNKK